MSHTNSTTNYGLPEFLSSDKPAWMADINTAFATIDTTMKANETLATTANTDIGTTGLNLAPGYSNASTYSVGDIVMYNKRTYICDVAVTVPEAFDDTKWSYYRLSDAGETTNANADLLGNTDISSIGDGTVTGAVSTLNSNLSGNNVTVSSQSGHVSMTMNNSSVQGTRVNILASAVSDESGGRVSTAPFLQVSTSYRPNSNRQIGCIIIKSDGSVAVGAGYIDSDGYLYQNVSSSAQTVLFIGSFIYNP